MLALVAYSLINSSLYSVYLFQRPSRKQIWSGNVKIKLLNMKHIFSQHRLYLVCQEKTDGLKRLLPSVHVIPWKKIIEYMIFYHIYVQCTYLRKGSLTLGENLHTQIVWEDRSTDHGHLLRKGLDINNNLKSSINF